MSFIYITAPPGTPEPLLSLQLYTEQRYIIEAALTDMNLNRLDRLDLLDGRRVFRVDSGEQPKITKDNQGPFVMDASTSALTKLRFTDVDPSTGLPVRHDWQRTH